MGWWRAGKDGSSLHLEETGLVWGDSVADIMDDAIDRIVQEFSAEGGRRPTEEELKAGLLFSLGGYEEPSLRELATNVGPIPGQPPWDIGLYLAEPGPGGTYILTPKTEEPGAEET